jgi:hypothetical protein
MDVWKRGPWRCMFASSINNATMKLILSTTKRKGPSPTHPNVLEFTRATKSSSLIRQSFFAVLRDCPDCRRTGRLTQVIMRVMRRDTTNNRGQRTVIDGAIELLQGYEFNEHNKVDRALWKPVTAIINPVTGLCLVTCPQLWPWQDLRYEGNYTHVRFTAAAGCFDFGQEPVPVSIVRTAYLRHDQSTNLELATMVNVRDGCPILLLLGIEIFHCVNGNYYPLSRGGTLALQIAAVERGAAE